MLLVGFDLQHVEWAKFQIGNPAGKGLARLAQQIDGCRSEQQELTCRLPTLNPLVNDAAQDLEQTRAPVELHR